MKLKMMILGMIVIVANVICCSSNDASVFTIPKQVDFGIVNIDDTEEYELKLYNRSNNDIKIEKINVPGTAIFKAWFAEALPYTLTSQETVTFEILFKPIAVDEVKAVVEITTDYSSKNLEIKVKGSGKEVPRISVSSELI